MKKLIPFIFLLAFNFSFFSSAQEIIKTNSLLRIGVWEGKWTNTGFGESIAKLNVESIEGRHIKAQLNLVERQNTIVELSGEIANSFGDFAEQSRWQFVEKDKKFKDGTWLKFTEVKLVQGNSEVKATYYGFLKENSLSGCWYFDTDPQPRGRFALRPAAP